MEANEVLTEQIIETIIEPTIEPILEDVKEPYHDNNWDLVYLRNTRNHYLTDKYLLLDYAITPENLEIIKLYRQELRDYIKGILNG